jgi:Leucine-rich repeat (LRR) protein
MKKNDWILLVSVFLYTFLFYQESIGLNFLIFNVAIIALLLARDRKVLRSGVWLLVAMGALISSFFIFLYSSPLSICANVVSLLLLSSLSINSKVSFFTAIFQSLSSISLSIIFVIMDWVEKKQSSPVNNKKRPFYVKFFLLLIPLLIAVVFFFFYQSANPLFYNFTKDINLDFISISWILFTLSAFFIMYSFYNIKRLQYFSDLDVQMPLELSQEIAARKSFLNSLMKIDTENLSGIILFSMLNGLLLLLNILDLNYLWFDGKLPEGITHKAFVHDGVGMLITSIVLAIIIILFYFRGAVNYYHNNKWIKRMAYVWIIQNLFMIFSTAYRNNMYIQESGLSYKKIGVYVYLLLTIVGLVSTFIKVYRIKTNWYLFKINAFLYYIFLIIACMPNWDVIITDYNIYKCVKENKKLEKYFLVDLSYKNLPQLFLLPSQIANADDFVARDYYNNSRGVFFNNFHSGRSRKLYDFLETYYSLSWKSFCFEKSRTYNDLLEVKDNIKSIDLSLMYQLKTLEPLKEIKNISSINISGTSWDSISELSYFPNLYNLNISDCNIKSLEKLPELIRLTELDISNNNSLRKFSELNKLKVVKVLNVSSNKIKDASVIPQINSLEVLDLSNNRIRNINSIKKFENVKKLNLSQNEISDSADFSLFCKLNDLNISNNNIKHNYKFLFEKLSNCKELKYLNLSNNTIYNLALVFPEPNRFFLKYLDCSSCSIKSINGVENVGTLESINLSNNRIVEIKALAGLKNVEFIDLSGNDIKDITPLLSLEKLKRIDISSNTSVSTVHLPEIKSIDGLFVSNCGLQNVDFLKKMTQLKYLDLSGNEIDDLSSIRGLKKLIELDISNNSYKSVKYDLFLELKNLKKLRVSNFSREDMIKLTQLLPNVEVEIK